MSGKHAEGSQPLGDKSSLRCSQFAVKESELASGEGRSSYAQAYVVVVELRGMSHRHVHYRTMAQPAAASLLQR